MPTPTAYLIKQIGAGYLVPVLVDAHGYEYHRGPAYICPQHCTAYATRHGARRLDYLGTFDHTGARITPPACPSSPSDPFHDHHTDHATTGA